MNVFMVSKDMEQRKVEGQDQRMYLLCCCSGVAIEGASKGVFYARIFSLSYQLSVLDYPERAMDEARIILYKGSTELLNTKFGDFLESMGIDKGDLALGGKEKPQQRRGGLGRKRAHFLFKPVLSQPSKNLEPNFDIDQLQDPSGFFVAYEKVECKSCFLFFGLQTVAFGVC